MPLVMQRGRRQRADRVVERGSWSRSRRLDRRVQRTAFWATAPQGPRGPAASSRARARRPREARRPRPPRPMQNRRRLAPPPARAHLAIVGQLTPVFTLPSGMTPPLPFQRHRRRRRRFRAHLSWVSTSSSLLEGSFGLRCRAWRGAVMEPTGTHPSSDVPSEAAEERTPRLTDAMSVPLIQPGGHPQKLAQLAAPGSCACERPSCVLPVPRTSSSTRPDAAAFPGA